jgi:hypothetical protein
MLRYIIGVLALSLAFLILAAVMIVTGHASITKERPNTLGVAQFYDNPFTYLFALPIEGKYVDGNLNVRFQPYASADLFDESVLFCGDVSDKFEGKKGPLVITYRIQASHMVQSIGCHELLSVFEVRP